MSSKLLQATDFLVGRMQYGGAVLRAYERNSKFVSSSRVESGETIMSAVSVAKKKDLSRKESVA